MTLTGKVSDFDKDGLFGLIIADDGSLLPFNLHEAPSLLRERCQIGTRVKFIKHASKPIARAVLVASIDAADDSGMLRATASGP